MQCVLTEKPATICGVCEIVETIRGVTILKEKPATIRGVCEIVETMRGDTPGDMIKRSVDINGRVRICMTNNGGHFLNIL